MKPVEKLSKKLSPEQYYEKVYNKDRKLLDLSVRIKNCLKTIVFKIAHFPYIHMMEFDKEMTLPSGIHVKVYKCKVCNHEATNDFILFSLSKAIIKLLGSFLMIFVSSSILPAPASFISASIFFLFFIMGAVSIGILYKYCKDDD